MRVVPETYKISTEQFTLCRVGDDRYTVACSIRVVATQPSGAAATLLLAVPDGTQTDSGVIAESEVDVALLLLSNLTDVGHAWVIANRGPFLMATGTTADEQVISFEYTAPGPMAVPLGAPYPEVPSATTVNFIGRHGPMLGGDDDVVFIDADVPSTHFRRANRPQLTLTESRGRPRRPPPRRPPCLVQ